MSLHHKKEYNTKPIVEGLKAHGLTADKPNQLSDAFRAGWVQAQKDCLNAIEEISMTATEDVMNGHEDAYRAIQKLSK
jgi:hypothetical protein